MMCEAVNHLQSARFNQGLERSEIAEENGLHLACNNISLNVSDKICAEEHVAKKTDASSKSLSFLDNLIRKKPFKNEKKKEDSTSGWSNIFARKSSPERKRVQEDEEMAKLIEQLELEGRSEADINLHLSYIRDVSKTAPASPKGNLITQWFREVQEAIKEEFSLRREEPFPEYDFGRHGMTVSISTAPFYGAPPPDMDMTYEELACLEPIYIGSGCINNLPSCNYDGTPLPGEQTSCPVCICEFTKGETLKSLPCVHFFHEECIDRWLMVGHTCPMCKMLVE